MLSKNEMWHYYKDQYLSYSDALIEMYPELLDTEVGNYVRQIEQLNKLIDLYMSNLKEC